MKFLRECAKHAADQGADGVSMVESVMALRPLKELHQLVFLLSGTRAEVLTGDLVSVGSKLTVDKFRKMLRTGFADRMDAYKAIQLNMGNVGELALAEGWDEEGYNACGASKAKKPPVIPDKAPDLQAAAGQLLSLGNLDVPRNFCDVSSCEGFTLRYSPMLKCFQLAKGADAVWASTAGEQARLERHGDGCVKLVYVNDVEVVVPKQLEDAVVETANLALGGGNI